MVQDGGVKLKMAEEGVMQMAKSGGMNVAEDGGRNMTEDDEIKLFSNHSLPVA